MGGLDMGQYFPALLSFQPDQVSMYGQHLCNSDQIRDRGPSKIWKGEGGYNKAVLLVEFQVRTPKTKLLDLCMKINETSVFAHF